MINRFPRQFDAAFHLAVHVKILATGEFSLDDDGFPNVGNFCGLRVSIDFGLLGPVYHVTGAGNSKSPDYLPDPNHQVQTNQVAQKIRSKAN